MSIPPPPLQARRDYAHHAGMTIGRSAVDRPPAAGRRSASLHCAAQRDVL